MARKLSQIARQGIALVLIIASWLAASNALAEGQAISRRATVTYQNPFANKPAGPPIEMPLRPGPINRWQRLAAPVVEPTPIENAATAEQSEAANPASAPPNPFQPAPTAWDQLPPAEMLRGMKVASAQSADVAVTQEPMRLPEPHQEPQPLLQPPWLTNTEDSEEALAADRPIKQIHFSGQANADANDPLLVAFDLNSLKLPVDELAEAIAPDESQAAIIAEEKIAPPVADDANSATKLLQQAQEAAISAQSIDELTTVAELCQKGITANAQPEVAAAIGRLGAWAHNRRGELYCEADRQQEAFNDFQVAISLDPNFSLAIHNRAVSFGQRNQFAAALQDFDRVIELNPGLAVAYRNRGELLAAMGRMEEAAADYNHAIDALPDDATLYRARAYALQRMGEFDRALADLNRSIKLDSSDPATFTQRGNLAAERGDFAQSLNDFDHAITIDQNCAEAHRSLAWLRATCEDPAVRDASEALAEAERAASMLPADDYLMLDTLAAAHAVSQRYTEATQLQKQALAAAPPEMAEPLQHRLSLYEQGASQGKPRIQPAVRQASHQEPSNDRR